MRKHFLRSAEAITKEKHKKHGRNKLIVILACLVVFCTTYALILPAITMNPEKRLLCSEESLSGHVHTESCRDENGALVCGYADFVLHTHEADCFDAEGTLICPLAEIREHQHTEACTEETAGIQNLAHTTQEELACGQTAHTHTDSCYDETGALVCGAVQLLQHQHTEDCFETVKPEAETLHPEPEDEVRTLAVQGEDYTVSVAFPAEAGLPKDVALSVREILPDTAEYADYYAQTAALLPEDQGLFFCRFFDVSFLADGVEVEPLASVDVQISYTDPVPQEEGLTCTAVHFAEDGVEVLPAEIQENENGEDAITFSQDSFSVVGTAISALNLNNGSYIFYKDGYAIGANNYQQIVPFPITVDENGYVYPKNTGISIDRITWTYRNGRLQNKATGEYMVLQDPNGSSVTTTPTTSASGANIDARIINNAVRFSQAINGTTATFYLGLNTSSSSAVLSVGHLFADGDYFLSAKVAEVDDVVIEPGDLEIEDQIREKGCIVPKLNVTLGAGMEPKYVWYRSKDNGQTWTEVVRTRITGESYNTAADGSWVNIPLDKGADTLYKVVLQEISGGQLADRIESQPFRVPYYDSIQNGDFEEPKISTDVSDPEHYQPLLPNGTAGMIWRTTAGDNKVEYVSVDSDKFREYSTNWHNCESAASGVQYVELNAGMPGALYQDVLTVPGSTMYWSLAHRGRGVNKANISDADNTKDTMYVVIMSTVLAEKYNITTQAAVEDVLKNPRAYPGAKIEKITDTSKKWVYHTGDYTVPDDQYLTRYFFVAGETAYDKYQPGSGLVGTIGNHLDDIHFSTELPPPADGKVNLFVVKNIVGLDEDTAYSALINTEFDIGGTTVRGSDFKNFEWNGENAYTAIYQVQIDIGSAASVTKTVTENLNSADQSGYDRTTTVAVNRGDAREGNRGTVTIPNQNSGLITFTNTYKQQPIDLRLLKVDENGLRLSGAKFSLEYLDGTQWKTLYPEIEVDSRGWATVPDLTAGSPLYRLTEIAAPSGYQPLSAPIYFKLDYQLGVLFCDENGEELDGWPDMVGPILDFMHGIKITNQPGLILPETGGAGTAPLYFAGLCLLVISITLMGFTRKKRKGGPA